ncbi:cytochrome c maturation protein CcmE [Pararhodobacter sp.]|uniref:cytochrome c maturation protein CcmE n=1 Tax=Pararhodobacter sp. TaxID=2127056 RepID=UPI002AFEEF8C|nr:cytochrome c maturation protein CcmE [Pararhodobacter sp.]
MAGLKSLKKKRRVQIIVVAAVALALSTGLIGYAMRDGINFFRSPSQVLAEPPTANEVFRLGGMVEVGSLQRGQGEEIAFRVTDFCHSVEVTYRGILPDLFGENEGTVATGRLVDGVFQASEILAKHDETYMPREVSNSLDGNTAETEHPECAYHGAYATSGGDT